MGLGGQDDQAPGASFLVEIQEWNVLSRTGYEGDPGAGAGAGAGVSGTDGSGISAGWGKKGLGKRQGPVALPGQWIILFDRGTGVQAGGGGGATGG